MHPITRARRNGAQSTELPHGRSEIRTHESLSAPHAFQACALNHSATRPFVLRLRYRDQIAPPRASSRRDHCRIAGPCRTPGDRVLWHDPDASANPTTQWYDTRWYHTPSAFGNITPHALPSPASHSRPTVGHEGRAPNSCHRADGVRFELTIPGSPVCRFSRPVPSTTRPPVRGLSPTRDSTVPTPVAATCRRRNVNRPHPPNQPHQHHRHHVPAHTVPRAPRR